VAVVLPFVSGGQKETDILASALRMKLEIDGQPVQIETATYERQCDPEYVARFKEHLQGVDAVVSMACGVGVQFMAENYPEFIFVPGQNTTFAGAAVEHGIWEERCMLCGECVLAKTGGVCPVIRCSKSLMNGPAVVHKAECAKSAKMFPAPGSLSMIASKVKDAWNS